MPAGNHPEIDQDLTKRRAAELGNRVGENQQQRRTGDRTRAAVHGRCEIVGEAAHFCGRVVRPLDGKHSVHRAQCARRHVERTSVAQCAQLADQRLKLGDRPALKRMLKEVGPGDIVVVTRLDRLARSVRDLLSILERFGQDNVGFVSLREKHIDTTSAGGRLVLNIMASIAEFERELISARMAEGRRRAVDNGVQFGRPHKLDSFQKREALARIEAGESQSLIARTYGVDRATISRLQKRSAMQG